MNNRESKIKLVYLPQTAYKPLFKETTMKKFICLASILFLTTMGIKAQQQTTNIPKKELQEAIASHKKNTDETTLIKNGEKAIEIEVAKYTGGKISLSNYRGKVIHICFWASWCGPCLKELKAENLPAVIAPYRKKSDYVLIPIALEKKESLDKFFASEKGKSYAWLKELTGFDPKRDGFNKYAKLGIPRTVVIDRDGKVVETSIGGDHYEMQLIEKALEKLF